MARKIFTDESLTTFVDEVKSYTDSAVSTKAPLSHNHSASNITSGTLSSDRLPTVPISKGGTGATTLEDAKTNLEIPNIVYLTQAEYDALPDDKLTNGVEYRITDTDLERNASTTEYDNSSSGLEATNVQDAVDEVNNNLKEKATIHYGTSEPSSTLGAIGDLYVIYED